MALWCSGYGHWLDLSACAKALLALAANANVTMLLTLLTEDLKTEDLQSLGMDIYTPMVSTYS